MRRTLRSIRWSLSLSTSASWRILRFGSFEANARAGELRKQGLKVKLQDQPFQILIMLLERPGEVVTRQEIHRRLWPADTFVDFDHGLNNAVNRLREAIGDSADKPRFVETIPKKGYRFIGDVTGQAQLGEIVSTVAAKEQVVDTGPIGQKSAAKRYISGTTLIFAIALAIAVIAYFGWNQRSAHAYSQKLPRSWRRNSSSTARTGQAATQRLKTDCF